jgi:hypothetical protein
MAISTERSGGLKSKWLATGAILGLLPWVGGIIVGYVSHSFAFIAAIGLVLWLGKWLAIFAVSHRSHKPIRNRGTHMLADFFLFGTWYGVSAISAVFLLFPPISSKS